LIHNRKTSMLPDPAASYIGFAGPRCVGFGGLPDVARAAKPLIDRGEAVLILDAATSHPVELDFRGSLDEVLARLPVADPPAIAAADELPAARGPGRPKLGVVAREVTLLPRHWDWLARQRGGASVTLRRLVDEARRAAAGEDRIREAQEAAYRFLAVVAGNAPHYEDALRALFARDAPAFERLIAAWPADVAAHARRLAAAAFPASVEAIDPSGTTG
jgi:hypothetical protein